MPYSSTSHHVTIESISEPVSIFHSASLRWVACVESLNFVHCCKQGNGVTGFCALKCRLAYRPSVAPPACLSAQSLRLHQPRVQKFWSASCGKLCRTKQQSIALGRWNSSSLQKKTRRVNGQLMKLSLYTRHLSLLPFTIILQTRSQQLTHRKNRSAHKYAGGKNSLAFGTIRMPLTLLLVFRSLSINLTLEKNLA